MTPPGPDITAEKRAATKLRLPSVKPSGLVTPVLSLLLLLLSNVNGIRPAPNPVRTEKKGSAKKRSAWRPSGYYLNSAVVNVTEYFTQVL